MGIYERSGPIVSSAERDDSALTAGRVTCEAISSGRCRLLERAPVAAGRGTSFRFEESGEGRPEGKSRVEIGPSSLN